jgi:hypothetical protein
MIRFATLPSVVAFLVALSAPAVRADQGSVWTRSQDGQVLNKVGVWQRENGRARITLLGTTEFLEVDMNSPLSSANGVSVFIYTAIDTKGQPNNSQIWRAVARGEILLDFRTARNNGVDGSWRKTEWIRDTGMSLELVREPSPPQNIRFIVE